MSKNKPPLFTLMLGPFAIHLYVPVAHKSLRMPRSGVSGSHPREYFWLCTVYTFADPVNDDQFQ